MSKSIGNRYLKMFKSSIRLSRIREAFLDTYTCISFRMSFRVKFIFTYLHLDKLFRIDMYKLEKNED